MTEFKKPDGMCPTNLHASSKKNIFYFYTHERGIKHHYEEGYIAGYYREGWRLYDLYCRLGEFFKNDKREKERIRKLKMEP